MTEGAARRPAHARRRSRLAAVGALVAAIVVAVTMLVGGQLPDPPTAALAAALAVAVGAGRRSDLVPHRRGGPALDEVDPATGVGNARAVLALLDREVARARSYGSLFSVAVLEADRLVFADLHPRRANRVRVDLVRGVAADVRAGDRVCRVSTSDRDLVVVVLPDTGATGAHTFADRLLTHAHRQLCAEGATPDRHLRTEVLSHPDDGVGLDRLKRRIEVLEGNDALVRDVTVGRGQFAGTGGRRT